MRKSREVPKATTRTTAAEAMERRLLMSTFTVNTFSDAVAPVSGRLTLRQAVADANTNAGADTIAFDRTVFTPATSHSIVLMNGPISFTDTSGTTTVTGPGLAVLAVDGNKQGRVLQIASGVNVSISGLTITDGAVNTSAGVLASGGGVQNAGALTLTGVAVSDDTVTLASATMNDPYGFVPANAEGAGIFSTGSLSLTNCTITGNSAVGGSSYGPQAPNGSSYGGGIYSTGSLTITGSTVSDNIATGGSNPNESSTGGNASGGGIYTTASFSMTSSTVSGNMAAGGTALQNGGGGYLGGTACGGGVFTTSDSAISGSSFTSNSANAGYSDEGGDISVPASAWGGALFSTGVLTVESSTFTKNQVMGGGRPANDNGLGGNAYGGAIAAKDDLTITNSTFSTNSAVGGVASETIGGTTAARNSSDFGGAVYSTKSLMLLSSTVSGNIAQADQVDDLYGGGGGYSQGGGVFITGTATIEASTLNGNIAEGGLGMGTGGTGGAGEGAAIFNGGTTNVTNSTIVDNQSEGGLGGDGTTANGVGGNGGNGGDGIGAGIYSTGTLKVYNGTVTGNTASGGGAGHGGDQGESNGTAGTGLAAGVDIASGTAVFSNTILSGNTANGSSDDDISGSASSSSGYNLIGFGGGLSNGVNGDKVGVTDPKLGALANNGGPTLTMIPLAGSPVIDAGSDALIPTGISTDQRGSGFSRVFNGKVDIGAVEYGGITVTPSSNQTAIAGQSVPVTLGSFTVSGATGPFTVNVNWGDGLDSNFMVAAAGTIPTQSHSYASAGSDTVTISVADSVGDKSSGQTFMVTVQEPSQIVPIFIRPNVPKSVIAGAKLGAKLPLLLTNSAAASKGTFTINYYANEVSGLDGNQTLLISVSRKLSLKAGRHATISTTIKSLPSNLPAGTYYLLAEVVDPLGLASIAIVSKTVALAAPFTELSGSVGSINPEILTTLRSGSIILTISNHGNIAASGLLGIAVYPSSDGTPQTSEILASFLKKVVIGTGHGRRCKLRVKVPPTLQAGNYFPSATITLNGQLVMAVGTTQFSVG